MTLLGRVGSNPVKRGSPDHPVVTFSLATNSNYSYANGLSQNFFLKQLFLLIILIFLKEISPKRLNGTGFVFLNLTSGNQLLNIQLKDKGYLSKEGSSMVKSKSLRDN